MLKPLVAIPEGGFSMGDGGSSAKNKAKKVPRKSSTAREGEGGGSRDVNNSCLFQFTENFIVDTVAASNVKVGATVALVPSALTPTQLDVFIGAARAGTYTGKHIQRILACINQKYSYIGRVESVTALLKSGYNVRCTIQGRTYE